MILRRSTLLSQPQGPAEVDWYNPVTIGLIAASNGRDGTHGLNLSAIPKGLSKSGTVLVAHGASGYRVPLRSSVTSSEWTLFSRGSIPGTNYQAIFGLYGSSSEFISQMPRIFPSNAFGTDARPYAVDSSSGSFLSVGAEFTITTVISASRNVIEHYINGALVSSASLSSTSQITVNSIEVFTKNLTQDRAQAGTTIGTFAAFNRALTAKEVGALSATPWQLFRPVQRRMYFDMGAGGGAATVSSDQSATYLIRGSVSSDQAASYAIRSSVSADLSASYNIQTAIAVSSDLSSGYEIRTSAQSDALAEYAIRASVQADSSAAYEVRSSVQSDIGAAFVARGSALSDASASYVVRTSASADLIAAYEIQTASGVSSSLDASYNVRAAVQADVSAAYDLRTSVGAASEHAFMVRGLVSSDLDASFTVEAPITQVYADLQAAYLVDGGAVFIPSQFVASVPAGVFSARAPAGEYSATVPGNYRASI